MLYQVPQGHVLVYYASPVVATAATPSDEGDAAVGSRAALGFIDLRAATAVRPGKVKDYGNRVVLPTLEIETPARTFHVAFESVNDPREVPEWGPHPVFVWGVPVPASTRLHGAAAPASELQQSTLLEAHQAGTEAWTSASTWCRTDCLRKAAAACVALQRLHAGLPSTETASAAVPPPVQSACYALRTYQQAVQASCTGDLKTEVQTWIDHLPPAWGERGSVLPNAVPACRWLQALAEAVLVEQTALFAPVEVSTGSSLLLPPDALLRATAQGFALVDMSTQTACQYAAAWSDLEQIIASPAQGVARLHVQALQPDSLTVAGRGALGALRAGNTAGARVMSTAEGSAPVEVPVWHDKLELRSSEASVQSLLSIAQLMGASEP